MYATKQARYAPYSDELERSNVKYEPMVWSAYGRPHANTVRIIRQLAKRAARRRGLPSASIVERRTHAKIAVEIWRRAARMVGACLPRKDEECPGGDDSQTELGKSEPPEVATPGV